MDYITLMILTIIIVLSYLVLTQRKKGLPPGPIGWPIINNYGYIKNKNSLNESLAALRNQYGDIFSLRFMRKDIIVLNGPEVIREALVTNADDFSERPRLFTSSGVRNNSGIINNHKFWKDTRKFSLVALKDFGLGKKSLEDKLTEEIGYLTQSLASENGKPCCVDVMMNKSVSNIICSITFGKRFEYDDIQFEQLLYRFTYLLSVGGGPYSTVNFNIFWQAIITVVTKIFGELPVKTMTYFKDIRDFVRERIEEHKETFDPSDIRDIIDLCIEAEYSKGTSKVSVDDCFELVIDLFGAGTETTSNSLKWFILYMMHEQAIQEKCYKEIAKNIGSSSIKMSDRGKCPYFEATLLEVQRMATLAPMSLPHTANKDLYFRGHFFPKGVVVVPNLTSAHKDATYWGDPEVFRPERWLSPEGKLIQHSAFMPFSLGRRACLGKQLAQMELFLFASSLVQRFSFQMLDTSDPPTLEGIQSLTLVPKRFQMKAIARSHAN